VVYLTLVPDMEAFKSRFYIDHERSATLPIVDQATAHNKNNPLLPVGPGLKPAALGLPVFEQLALDASFQLFLAQLPDENGHLQFIAGCQANDAAALAEKMEAAAKKLMPIIEWKIVPDAPNAKETFMLGAGTVRVSHVNGWTLVGTALPEMIIMEKRLRGVELPAAPLSSTKLWQQNMGAQDPNALLIYFTNLRFAAEAAQLVGDASYTRLLSRHLSGIDAYSWTWNSAGAESLAYDKMIFSLYAGTREALSQIFLPVRDLPRGLANSKTLVKFAARVNLTNLSKAPALQGTKLSKSLTGTSMEVDYAFLIDDSDDLFARPVAHWIGTDQPAAIQEWWSAHFPGDTVFEIISGGMLVAKSAKDVVYFASKLQTTPDRNPLYNELPAVNAPFASMELDTARITGSLYQSVRQNPVAWNAWLEKEDIKFSETLPELDPAQYLTLCRVTIGLEGDNLVVFNSLKTGGLTNSLYTAISNVATWTGRKQMEADCTTWRSWFEWKQEGGLFGQAPRDDFFTAFLWSNHFAGPVLTGERSLTLFLDLYSFVFLATPPNPLGR